MAVHIEDGLSLLRQGHVAIDDNVSTALIQWCPDHKTYCLWVTSTGPSLWRQAKDKP